MARVNTEIAEDDSDSELYVDHSKVPASSPSPNTSSDKENSQSTGKMQDTLSVPSNRKRRGVLSSASVSTTPAPASSRKSRKRSSSAAGLTSGPEDSSDDENQSENGDVGNQTANFYEHYDPNQPVAERRRVQRKYRDLHRKIQDNKNAYLVPDKPQALLDVFDEVNNNFKEVKQTADACIDAKVLLTVGDLAVKRAKVFVSGSASQKLDIDDFITKTMAYLGTSPQANEFRGSFDWAHLGRTVVPLCTARPATTDFLLGPLSVVKRQRVMKDRKPVHRRREADLVRPQDLDKDKIAANENSTTKHVITIGEALKKYVLENNLEEHGVSYFKFVINPKSFAQTVENIFYASFLVRDGLAALMDGPDGMLNILPTEPVSREEAIENDVVRRQIVMDMDKKTWMTAIEIFKLKDCVIPMREKESSETNASGWYS